MVHAIESELFIYADDSCLTFQHVDNQEIERKINRDLTNICGY